MKSNLNKSNKIIYDIDLKEYSLNKRKFSSFKENPEYEFIKEYIKNIKEEAINAQGDINYQFNAGDIDYGTVAQLANIYVKLQINPNITLNKLKENIAKNNNFYENTLDYYIAEAYSKEAEKELNEKKEQLEELLKNNPLDSSELKKAKKNKNEIIKKEDFIEDLNNYCNYETGKIFGEYFNINEVKQYLEYIFDSLDLIIANNVIKAKNGNITHENLAKAYIILNKLKNIKKNGRESSKKNIESELKLSVKTHFDNVLIQVYQKEEKIKGEKLEKQIEQNKKIKEKLEQIKEKNNQKKEEEKALKEKNKQKKEEEKALNEQYKDYKPYYEIKNENIFERINEFIINNENIFDKYFSKPEIKSYLEKILKKSNFELGKDNNLIFKGNKATYQDIARVCIMVDSLRNIEKNGIEPEIKNIEQNINGLIKSSYKKYLHGAYDECGAKKAIQNLSAEQPDQELEAQKLAVPKEEELKSKLALLEESLNNWKPLKNIQIPQNDEISQSAEENSGLAEIPQNPENINQEPAKDLETQQQAAEISQPAQEYLFHINESKSRILGVDKLENIISFEVNAVGIMNKDNILICKPNAEEFKYVSKPFEGPEFKVQDIKNKKFGGKNENNEEVEFEANAKGHLTPSGLIIYETKSKNLGTFYLSYEPKSFVEISSDED